MESSTMGETGGPILHVIVVGFHHKKGCQVSYHGSSAFSSSLSQLTPTFTPKTLISSLIISHLIDAFNYITADEHSNVIHIFLHRLLYLSLVIRFSDILYFFLIFSRETADFFKNPTKEVLGKILV
uniref:AVL9_0 protein n=1 Tax=Fopius arisanus TaxID=64838 RepID=A0A0C9QR14_9HYME